MDEEKNGSTSDLFSEENGELTSANGAGQGSDGVPSDTENTDGRPATDEHGDNAVPTLTILGQTDEGNVDETEKPDTPPVMILTDPSHDGLDGGETKNTDDSAPVTSDGDVVEPFVIIGSTPDPDGGDPQKDSSDTGSESSVLTAEGADNAARGTDGADIHDNLRRAGDRIDRAATDAEELKKRREKEEARKEKEEAKERESAEKRREKEEKNREAAFEERRAVMEYAEAYRRKLREEREKEAEAKRREDEREAAIAEERETREREIAESVMREREEARLRSERSSELVSRVGEITEAADAAVAEARASDSSEPSISEDVPEKNEPKNGEIGKDTLSSDTDDGPIDYTLTIEDDNLGRDMLFIEGHTVTNIGLGDAGAIGAEPRVIGGYTSEGKVEEGGVTDAGAKAPFKETADKRFSLYERSAMPKQSEERPRPQYTVSDTADLADITPERPADGSVPLTSKEQKRRRKEEKRAREREMLEFAGLEDASSTELTSTAEGGESSEEYIIPTATPRYDDGDALKAESIDKSNARSLKKERAALKKNIKRQKKNDLLLIEHRIYSEILELELRKKSGEMSYSSRVDKAKTEKERKAVRGSIDSARSKMKLAKKLEARDNERYYTLVETDLDKAKLSKKADREELKRLRSGLIELLRQRDELNVKLIEMYSGTSEDAKGSSTEKNKAILAAKRKAYKKQLKLARLLEKSGVGRDGRRKIFEKMDRHTELCGALAGIKYSLKTEKPKGKARRELLKERRGLKRELKKNEASIEQLKNKMIKDGKKRIRSRRKAIFGCIMLIVVVVIAVAIWMNWEVIMAWINGIISGLGSNPAAGA